MAGAKFCNFFSCGTKTEEDTGTPAKFDAPILAGNTVTAVAPGQIEVEAGAPKGTQAKAPATAQTKYEVPGTVTAKDAENLQIESLVRAGLISKELATVQMQAQAPTLQDAVEIALARIHHQSLVTAGLIVHETATENIGAGVGPRG